MIKTIATRNENTRARSRSRKHLPEAALAEPAVVGVEFDPSSMEALIHDYGDEEVRALHIEQELDASEEEHEEPRESLQERTALVNTQDEMSDTWMLRGGKAKLLTPAQEITLAKRVEKNDRQAREEILNANVRLVASVARRYLNRGLPLEDLMQEGLIGLLRAIDKYNYRKGYRFSTYATFWIRQAITRALANQGRSIRLPAHVVDSISRVARVRDELFQKNGRVPTRQEVAEAANITEKKLLQLLRSAAQPVSLEVPVGAEGESRLGDFIPAGGESSPEDRVFRYLVREELEHVLNTLNSREKAVIILRYGLEQEEPHTLEETGRRLHITRERARQIESKALEKLRHPSMAARLRESLG